MFALHVLVLKQQEVLSSVNRCSSHVSLQSHFCLRFEAVCHVGKKQLLRNFKPLLQGGVGGEDGVVGLHHSSGHLGSWVDGELQLGLLAIVNRQTLHQQGGETRAGAKTKQIFPTAAPDTSSC